MSKGNSKFCALRSRGTILDMQNTETQMELIVMKSCLSELALLHLPYSVIHLGSLTAWLRLKQIKFCRFYINECSRHPLVIRRPTYSTLTFWYHNYQLHPSPNNFLHISPAPLPIRQRPVQMVCGLLLDHDQSLVPCMLFLLVHSDLPIDNLNIIWTPIKLE